MSSLIGVLGAGRMGRGIALSYIFSGVPVLLVDLKERSDNDRAALLESVLEELAKDLGFFARVGLVEQERVPGILSLVQFSYRGDPENPLKQCSIVFEGVPEVMAAKQDAFSYASDSAAEDAIIASTTSTFLVTELADMVSHSARFMNAHWLNPAHLMPLEGLRCGVSSELADQELLDTQMVRLITGGDDISGRGLNQDQKTFTTTVKPIIPCNSKPIIDASLTAIVDRMNYIPFDARFVSTDEEKETVCKEKHRYAAAEAFSPAMITAISLSRRSWKIMSPSMLTPYMRIDP